MFSPDDYGSQFYIQPKDETVFTKGDDHEAVKVVPRSIPRSPGPNQEWFDMMKSGSPAYSNLDIAAYLTEILLLGCIALRVGESAGVRNQGAAELAPRGRAGCSSLRVETLVSPQQVARTSGWSKLQHSGFPVPQRDFPVQIPGKKALQAGFHPI